jgi:hypothetical protein
VRNNDDAVPVSLWSLEQSFKSKSVYILQGWLQPACQEGDSAYISIPVEDYCVDRMPGYRGYWYVRIRRMNRVEMHRLTHNLILRTG